MNVKMVECLNLYEFQNFNQKLNELSKDGWKPVDFEPMILDVGPEYQHYRFFIVFDKTDEVKEYIVHRYRKSPRNFNIDEINNDISNKISEGYSLLKILSLSTSGDIDKEGKGTKWAIAIFEK